MNTNQSDMAIAATLKRLLRRNARRPIQNIIKKTHRADFARVFSLLSPNQQQKLFNWIHEKALRGQVLTRLDPGQLEALVKDMDPAMMARVLEQIPQDDVVAVVSRLTEETADRILQQLKEEGNVTLQAVLQFGPNSAGGIMVPEFIALQKEISAGEAIGILQQDYRDVEMPFYLYVVDDQDRLCGVCSLRQLVTVPAQTPLQELMTTEVVSVRTDTDQEDVARLVDRYSLLAVPVTDEHLRIKGVVTVDDVIDIIRDEITEDMLKMAGAGSDYAETKSVLLNSRARLPWLLASCAGGLLATLIIGQYEAVLNSLVYLAAFIPVIMGMGGNIGTQSSTIVVRGLATEYIALHNPWQAVLKEIAVGALLGIIYGLLLGVVAFSRFAMWRLGVVVGLSVLISMSVSSLVGTLFPVMLARMKIDPAVATGPFVTTTIDIFAVWAYFVAATHLLTI
jgi:magnesium transporter